MGKKQHQKDKLWLTTTEWKTIYGGKKANDKNRSKYHRQPFHYCSLKYVPTKIPCCSPEGIVFEYEHILNFINKHKLNPITGKKLRIKNLLKIKFHKNIEDEFHCPITYKVFNDITKIVVVPNTGNVFSYEGLTVNNVKGDIWFDPLTNEQFNKKDLIVIQDPDNPDRFNMNAFYKKNDKKEETAPTMKISDSLTSEVMKEVMKQRKKEEENEKETISIPILKDKINEANYSTGKVAASFTSTSAPVAYINETAVLADDVVRYSRIKDKGYVSLVTNFGRINFELFCDVVPKTCENFIRLCKSNYYNYSKFHRLIRHFVLQGGDPTGTGKGGVSCWGKAFEDEFVGKFSHDHRGVLSMANSGPNTNQSQFFILLRPAKHLDKKHTIFGRVVGGLKVLDEIEQIESDNQDRPIEPIEILFMEVFVDPFEKVDEEIRKEREDLHVEKVDESLIPRNKKEEEEWRLKKSNGNIANAKSNTIAKYLKIPDSDDALTLSNSSKKKNKIDNPTGSESSVNVDEIDVNEYSIKVKKRKLNAVTNDLF